MSRAQKIGLVLAAVMNFPGSTERQLVTHVARYGVSKFDVYVILREQSNADAVVIRCQPGYDPIYYAAGAAPACAHTHARDGGNMFVDRTIVCLCCGATRKWSSAKWSSDQARS